jgi:hypothetical protein
MDIKITNSEITNSEIINSEIPNGKICLNMIVKNEEHCILETLQSIVKYIGCYVISDTGSTDNTINIIESFFKENNIEGKIINNEWVNFAVNRTYALEAIKNLSVKCDYIFIIDADDIVINPEILFEEFNSVIKNNEIDIFYLNYKDEINGIEYKRTQIFNNKLEWEYKSPIHEYIICKNKDNLTSYLLKNNYYILSRRKGNRNLNPQKYLNDALTLIKQYEIEPDILNNKNNKPNKVNYLFWIAQSYRNYGDTDNAIKYYDNFISNCLETQIYEKFYSYLCLGFLLIEKNKKMYKNEIIKVLINGYNCCKTRAECLVKLGYFYIDNYEYENALQIFNIAEKIPYPTDTFFIDPNAYNIQNIVKILNVYFNIRKTNKFNDYNFYLFKDNNIEDNNLLDLNKQINTFDDLFDLKNIANVIKNCNSFNTNGKLKKNININYLTQMNNLKLDKFEGIFIKKPILCLYLGYSRLTNFNAYGSELSAIKLMSNFTSQYNVYIISHDMINKNVDGINYYNYDNFNNYLLECNLTIEILIISRYINYFLDFSFKVNKTYIWVHDTELGHGYNNGLIKDKGKYLLNNVMHKIDKIIVLSEWHKEYFKNIYDIEENKLTIIGNGINVNNINNSNKINNRFIWTSSFDRGIERCLEYFEEIHNYILDAELHIFRDYDNYKHLVNKYSCDYIKFYGRVSNEVIIEEFKKASVWFYPTHFVETFCISSLEAQLNECLCIATNIGALTTTVGDRGILFNTDTLVNKKECVNLVINTLKQDNTALIKKAKIYAEQQTWYNKSKLWTELFNEKK